MTYTDRLAVVFSFDSDGDVWITANEEALDWSSLQHLALRLSTLHPGKRVIVQLRRFTAEVTA